MHPNADPKTKARLREIVAAAKAVKRDLFAYRDGSEEIISTRNIGMVEANSYWVCCKSGIILNVNGAS